MESNIKKQLVEVSGELALSDVSLPEIRTKLETAETVQEVITDIQILKRIETAMQIAEKEFDDKVKAAKASFNINKKELSTTLDKVKELALKQAEESLNERDVFKTVHKFDDDGVLLESSPEYVKTVRKTSLPGGIVYTKGRVSFDYHEDRVPDKYFKKTIKKTEVKKAIEEGILPEDLAIPKQGKSSIRIDLLGIEKGLKKIEEKKEEE